MLSTTKDDKGVLHVRISGKIDKDEMEQGLAEFFALSGDEGQFAVLFEARDIELPTLAAYGVEMRHLPKLFGLLPRMRPVALVSNQSWVRAAAKVESALLPGLSIAVFAPEDAALKRAAVGAA